MGGEFLAHALAALIAAVVAGVGGAFTPGLLARVPDPEEPEDDYIPYRELAATPGLGLKLALVSAAAGGVVGWFAYGPRMVPLIGFVPVGVLLAYVDWRIRMLPTKLVAPSYALVISLVALVALVERDWRVLAGAGIGWSCAGGLYVLLWLFAKGFGYGDVRLSGVLGILLGSLGLVELGVGIYAGFLLSALAWLPMRLLRLTTDRSLPFGPFMLLGVLLGVMAGALTGASA